MTGSATASAPADASASANARPVAKRSPGFSSIERARTACRRSAPGTTEPVSGPMSCPVPDGRRPVSSSNAIAPSEKTSAGVDQSPPGNPFRGAVRPADGCADPDPLERVDDAEAGGASLVWCNEDVTRMERAVTDTGPARDIDRFGQLPDDPQHRVDARRARSAASRRRATRRRRILRRDRRRCPPRRRRSARRSKDWNSSASAACESSSASACACSGVTSSRKTLTATRRSRVGSYVRNTGPSAPTPI